MSLSIFKIFTIFGTVSTWAEKALKDNVITLAEGLDLLARLAKDLGVRAELALPSLAPPPPDPVEEAKEEVDTEASETTEKAADLPSWARQ